MTEQSITALPAAQPTPKKERVLVTAALPYANGDAHMGHLVEYLMADMYVRSLKALGTDALLICASDAHGTPIELNAAKKGITPVALVTQAREAQQRDFARFGVHFDYFGNTHADSNKALVTDAYLQLKEAGWIVEKDQDGTFCEQDQRFLPDRFVKGTCPRCNSEDQYGDVCERCGATYGPEDLLAPKCALCGAQPIRKPSRHAFFRLSDPAQSAFLRAWIDSGTLQDDVANYVRSWLDGGLRDWCISRDKPYFGFPIPDMQDKFFYVWLDAPFGYVSASKDWADKTGHTLAELWRSPNTRIEHIIGKDIMYFHTLFWPAVLNATGYTLPAKVHVHGMLTVDGEKMSKSRGTFINAQVFAEHVEPEILRYYFATKYTPESRDIALSFADLVARINGELINKYVNLFSRLGRFVHGRLKGRLGALPFARAALHDAAAPAPAAGSWEAHALDVGRRVVVHGRAIEEALRVRDVSRATRELSAMADLGNEEMQAQEPWALIATDVERARSVCTFVANICDALITYLWPIVPQLAERAAITFKTKAGAMDSTKLFGLENTALGPFERLLERLDPKALEKVVEASKVPDAADAKAEPSAAAQASSKPGAQAGAAAAGPRAGASAGAASAAKAVGGQAKQAVANPHAADKPTIAFDAFAQVQLRVGTVRAAERVPKSSKLLRLQVDLGEASLRQVLAGVGKVYAPEALVGSQVIVVANLQPATIMGQQSCGMVLAGDDDNGAPVLLRPSAELPPGAPVH